MALKTERRRRRRRRLEITVAGHVALAAWVMLVGIGAGSAGSWQPMQRKWSGGIRSTVSCSTGIVKSLLSAVSALRLAESLCHLCDAVTPSRLPANG